MKNRPRKLKNRWLEGVWELLGATLGRKMSKRLSWPIWTDFGQARDAQNGDKMAELGAKMAPRCPRWGLSGHLEADWGVILSILKVLGAIFAKWLKYENEHHYSVLATFSGLGGSGWRLSGQSWGILARSWAILGDLGVKMGPCWQHVGGKMAKKGEKMRT